MICQRHHGTVKYIALHWIFSPRGSTHWLQITDWFKCYQ